MKCVAFFFFFEILPCAWFPSAPWIKPFACVSCTSSGFQTAIGTVRHSSGWCCQSMTLQFSTRYKMQERDCRAQRQNKMSSLFFRVKQMHQLVTAYRISQLCQQKQHRTALEREHTLSKTHQINYHYSVSSEMMFFTWKWKLIISSVLLSGAVVSS